MLFGMAMMQEIHRLRLLGQGHEIPSPLELDVGGGVFNQEKAEALHQGKARYTPWR